MEDTWQEVDETGHVPGVAAELPPRHRVLLDASGNIGAIVAIRAVIGTVEQTPGVQKIELTPEPQPTEPAAIADSEIIQGG